MRWISFITSGYFIQIKNTLSSQVHMEHSPGQTTFRVTNTSKSFHFKPSKSNLSKFKKIEIVSSIFHDNNAMRLDLNYNKTTVRKTIAWRLNNMFLNNQQVTEEIKRETKKKKKKTLETNDSKMMTTQNLWDEAKAVLRWRFIAIKSYLEKREMH